MTGQRGHGARHVSRTKMRVRPIPARAPARALTLAAVLAAGLAMPGMATATETPAVPQAEAIRENDPLKVVVSLASQRISVYRGDRLLDSAPVSTGRRGYSTPSGVFSILEKRRRHFSNLYNNAPMPYMQRLTWSGIALHQGRLPGYPASHGCIRLPRQFAKTLFGLTERGAHVVVARDEARPVRISHRTLFQPTHREDIIGPSLVSAGGMTDGVDAAALAIADAEAASVRLAAFDNRDDAPLRILITRRTVREEVRGVQRMLTDLGYDPGPVDGIRGRMTIAAIKAFEQDLGFDAEGRIHDELIRTLHAAAELPPPATGHLYVRQNYVDIFDAPITIRDAEDKIGTHVYTLMNYGEGERGRWTMLTAEAVEGATARGALNRIELPGDLRRKIEDMLTPGSSVIISDHGIGRETGRGTDFIVLTRT